MRKKCFKCGRVLPIEKFYKHPEMKDGFLGKCKECTKIDVSSNYRKNIEHYKTYEKERYTTTKRKKQILEYQKQRRKRYPEKEIARSSVANAIKDKRLSRKTTCEICGSTEKIEAHHEDYSKPLNVKWLCFVCHRKQHNQYNYSEVENG
jgi:hypothetical protein